jgi:hypothetical protein
MNQPVSVDVPHNLGAAEARRRIEENLGRLGGKLPAGVEARPVWEGDRLRLDLSMMGQRIDADLDIQDALVRITIQLSPALALFRQAIEAGLRQSGGALLEDRTKG